MNEPVDLRMQRLRKIEDSKDITAIENLEVMIDDIKKKGLQDVRLTALMISSNPDGTQTLHPYNAGLDRAQEIGYISAFLKIRVEDFLG